MDRGQLDDRLQRSTAYTSAPEHNRAGAQYGSRFASHLLFDRLCNHSIEVLGPHIPGLLLMAAIYRARPHSQPGTAHDVPPAGCPTAVRNDVHACVVADDLEHAVRGAEHKGRLWSAQY